MSSLRQIERSHIDRILHCDQLDIVDYYSHNELENFFRQHGALDYYNSNSKKKSWEEFWAHGPDTVVGSVLEELLEVYELRCEENEIEPNRRSLKECRRSANRLVARTLSEDMSQLDKIFLRQHIEFPDMGNLPIRDEMVSVIEGRVEEAQNAMRAGCHLSVIVLCGSILEGILIEAASRRPDLFGKAIKPYNENDEKSSNYPKLSLAEAINYATDAEMLKPDVREFSHSLRQFRNYIHPKRQYESKFAPDEHTARICFQVLKAALASMAGERQ